jgi:hypothetical protein
LNDYGWFGKLAQYFNPLVAAWTAVLVFWVHLKKVRNERLRDAHAEESSDWTRLRDERDSLRAYIPALLKENKELRAELRESERVSNERLGRAVIAEATNVSLNKELGRPSVLPGTSEGEHRGNGA